MARQSRIDRCPECGSRTVKISWSSLKSHEECKQKGHLTREKKKIAVADIRNFFPGRVTDRVVRDWLNGAHEKGSMLEMVEPIIERELGEAKGKSEVVSWKSTTDRSFVAQQCIKAVKNIEPALERYVLPYQWQVDFGFKAPFLVGAPDGGMDRVVLNGYMDIIVFDSATETWRIYDVKHTENKDYWRGSFGQLAFYSLANMIMFGAKPVEVGFFQPLVGEQIKRFAITDSEVNHLSTRVQAMAYDVWSGDVEPRKDMKVCHFCEVKHACSKFQPASFGF